jgi:hypothetical protein
MGLSPLPPLGGGLDEGITDSLESSGAEGLAGSSDFGPASGVGTSSDNSGLTSTSTSPSQESALTGILNGAKSALGSAAVSGIGTIFGIDSQSITVILGLILIVGGIFLFRPIQQLIVGTGKATAKKAIQGAIAA